MRADGDGQQLALDAAELSGLPGVGRAKLGRYGPDFLAVVAEHARA